MSRVYSTVSHCELKEKQVTLPGDFKQTLNQPVISYPHYRTKSKAGCHFCSEGVLSTKKLQASTQCINSVYDNHYFVYLLIYILLE